MTKEGYNELQNLYDEYVDDVSLNTMNITDKAMLAPTIKVKWVHRTRKYKENLAQAENAMVKLRLKEENVIRKQSKVELSDTEIKRLKLKNSEDIKKVQDKIDDLKSIIYDLEKYQKLIAFYSHDVKNAMDGIQLET